MRERIAQSVKLAPTVKLLPEDRYNVERPRVIVTVLSEDGMTQVRPGIVDALHPEMADRIRFFAETVRTVGLPVVVVLVDKTPKPSGDAA